MERRKFLRSVTTGGAALTVMSCSMIGSVITPIAMIVAATTPVIAASSVPRMPPGYSTATS
jgi:hypothetical protein